MPKAKRDWRSVRRSTLAVKLSLSPVVLLQLRTAARVRGVSVSEYVSSLATPEAPQAAGEVTLADVSRLAFAANQLPMKLERLHGELLRQGGLAKQLCVRGADPTATAEVLRSVRDVADEIERCLGIVLTEHDQIRADLARAALLLAGRA